MVQKKKSAAISTVSANIEAENSEKASEKKKQTSSGSSQNADKTSESRNKQFPNAKASASLPRPFLKFCQFAVLRPTRQNRRDPIFSFAISDFFFFFGFSTHFETSSVYLVMSIAARNMPFRVITIAQALTIFSIGFSSTNDKRLLNHGGVHLRCCFFGECFVEKGRFFEKYC